jgi:hypothetical protein
LETGGEVRREENNNKISKQVEDNIKINFRKTGWSGMD